MDSWVLFLYRHNGRRLEQVDHLLVAQRGHRHFADFDEARALAQTRLRVPNTETHRQESLFICPHRQPEQEVGRLR